MTWRSPDWKDGAHIEGLLLPIAIGIAITLVLTVIFLF